MASSGKKGKKQGKKTVLSLQTFLSNGDTTPLGTTQVAKNVRNEDDSDEGDNVVVCQLPTAPRANRLFDENPVPYKPPFIAYVTNLPFDVNEEDIYDFFNNNHIISVRLPRDDGESGRVRGFGYVEFETRDDLIYALGLPDPSLKGRRIRIELSHESDQNQRRGNRRGYDSGNAENRDSTNWRRDFNSDDLPRNDSRSSNSNAPSDRSGSWRSRERSYGADVGGDSKRIGASYTENKSNALLERPKLNLKPRTLPIPKQEIALEEDESSSTDKAAPPAAVVNKPAGVSAESVFGSAKPVDTTARDLEIEQRLIDIRKQEQESLRKEIEVSTIKEPLVENNWRKGDTNKQSANVNEGPENQRESYRDDNRRKFPEKSERNDRSKETQADGKQKDAIKGKRDYKSGPPIPKSSPKQNEETVLVSTNKYSGLEDDSE